MTKNLNKQPLVPKLRFPDFRGDKEWKEKPLQGLLTESKVRGSSGAIAKKITVKLWGNGVYQKNDAIKGSANTQYYIRKSGQFIYSKLDFLNQAFGIIPDYLDGYESTVDLPCFDIGKGLVPSFLLEYVQRKQFYKKFGEIADGGRIAKRIQIETFFSFPISLPPRKEEQQKIADCLGSLDELIAAHSARLVALQDHKKGLLQQLFPAEGQTTPTLRFPEFKSTGEWQKTKAGRLFKNRTERGVEGLEIYSVTMNDGLVSRSSLDRKFGDIAKPSGNKRVYESDIAYNMMRMWQGALGVAPKDCMVSPAYIVLSPRKDVCSPFFGHLFKRPESKKKLTAHSRGLTEDRLRLYYDDFSSINFYVPEPPEQQRIADCLSALDGLITVQINQIAALAVQKKGLMQQLFPNPKLSNK